MELEATGPVEPILLNQHANLNVRYVNVEHMIFNKEELHNKDMPFLPKGGDVYVFRPATELEKRDWYVIDNFIVNLFRGPDVDLV